MHILVWIITGIIAGWLAGLVVRGRGYGLLGDLVIGLHVQGLGRHNDFSESLINNPTVVPVPAAVWLFGSGLLALAGLVRRRN